MENQPESKFDQTAYFIFQHGIKPESGSDSESTKNTRRLVNAIRKFDGVDPSVLIKECTRQMRHLDERFDEIDGEKLFNYLQSKI